MTNNDHRAEIGHRCVMYFEQQTQVDRGDSLKDLLSNLMHWADQHGQDFEDALRVARMHYEAEVHEEA